MDGEPLLSSRGQQHWGVPIQIERTAALVEFSRSLILRDVKGAAIVRPEKKRTIKLMSAKMSASGTSDTVKGGSVSKFAGSSNSQA